MTRIDGEMAKWLLRRASGRGQLQAWRDALRAGLRVGAVTKIAVVRSGAALYAQRLGPDLRCAWYLSGYLPGDADVTATLAEYAERKRPKSRKMSE